MSRENKTGDCSIVLTIHGDHLFRKAPLKISLHIESSPSQAVPRSTNPGIRSDGLTVNVGNSRNAATTYNAGHDIFATGTWANDETMNQYRGTLSLSNFDPHDSPSFATTGSTQCIVSSHISSEKRSNLCNR
jgi:hypothetical protein